jgi:1-acyl-sn-glycerol-3-phosphate acyltransferase
LLVIRSFIFVVLFYLWSATFSILAIPLLLAPGSWMARALPIWTHGVHFLLWAICGIRVEIRGKQFIPKGPALVAPKHQCMLDVFSEFAVLPHSIFVMKKELVWIPFLAWYGLKLGCIVVDRAAHATALRKMVADAKLRFQKSRQLVIFPEGSRGEPGVAGDYKPGIAALYRDLEVPVHPVATNSGVHWPRHGFIRKPGVIVFEYLEPIQPGLKRGEFMRILEERIETASNKLLAL